MRSFVQLAAPQDDTTGEPRVINTRSLRRPFSQMETPRGRRSARTVPRGIPAVGYRLLAIGCEYVGASSQEPPGKDPLTNGQGANHSRLLVAGHVAVVLVGASRS